MEKNYLLYLLCLILCSSAVIGLESNGGTQQDYYPGETTLFTWENPEFTCTGTALTQPKGGALISDLDGDGNKEIIYIDSGSLVVRNYSKVDHQWSLPDSIVVSATPNLVSNIEILDYDGDGYTELVVADVATRSLKTYNYSNKTLFLESSHYYHAGNIEAIIKCGKQDECVVLSRSVTTVVITLMSSSGHISNISEADDDAQNVYFPNTKTISYADRNQDGVLEYATATYHQAARLSYIRFYKANTTHISLNSSITVGESDAKLTNYEYAQFSNALVIEAAPVAGSETLYAHNVDSNIHQTRFGMISSTTTTTSVLTGYIDRYPLNDPQGQHVGNIFRAPISGGSGLTYCYTAYYYTAQDQEADIQVVCGDEYAFSITESYETTADMDMTQGFYAMPNTTYFQPETTWTVHNDHPYYGDAVILNSYGVWAFDDITLQRVWTSPIGAPTQFSVEDYDDDGYLDFIGVTEEGIFFCNDGSINERPAFLSWSFDPDISKVIKTNSSLFITLKLFDDDLGDTVNAKFTIYADTSHNRSIGYLSAPSASDEVTFTYFFEEGMNVTGQGIILRAEWNDSEVPSIIKSRNITVYVSDQGVVTYGDGSSFSDEADEPDEPGQDCVTDADCPDGEYCLDGTCETNDDTSDNALTSAVGTFADITGLSGGMIVILVIFIISFAFIANRGVSNPMVLLGGVVLIIFAGVIIGAKIGLLSAGSVVIMAILGIIFIVLISFLFRGGG